MRQTANRSLVTTLVLAISLLLPSCSKEQPPEQERYKKLQEGVKFRTYKALSKRTVGPLAGELNKNRPPDAPEVDVQVLRMLLGFTWATSDKGELAIAEGQLILEGAQDPKVRGVGHILLAMGMHERGLTNMAKEETDKGVKAFDAEGDSQARQFLPVAQLVLGTNAVKRGNFKAARSYFGGFHTATGIQWPHTLADIMVDMESGNVQTGLTKAKTLSQDEQTPEELRTLLSQAIAKVEKDTGPVESKLFWPRLTSRLLLDEMRRNKHLSGLFQALDKARAAL